MDIFDSLSPEETEALLSNYTITVRSPGDLVMREGDCLEHLYIIVQGQVEIIKSLGSADERLLGVREAGTLLGEMSLFDVQSKHTASVRAITPLQVLQLSRPEFESMLQQHPSVMYALLRQTSLRLSQSENITIQDLREKNRQLTLAYEQLKEAQAQLVEKERLEHEMEIARDIQRSILPAELPVATGFDFGALMMPARAVGGDFYDLIDLGANRLGVVLGDVSDKGVPAALVMSMTQTLVRVEASRDPTPRRLAANVNQHLLLHGSSRMFVTLLYGVLDCTNGSFTYVRAGHPSPFLWTRHKPPQSLDFKLGQLLGILDNPILDEQQVTIPKGGSLLIFSDGVTEAANAQDEPFGEQGLSELLASLHNFTAQQACSSVFQAVLSHTQPLSQQDDITLVFIRRL
ncbi:MAG: cyclic nucleotide-binding domain-containing protein [Anaerolineae bacterium]|nr:cyclic nucleotide-binding domain-containing protein [Anaerolineae bacterium]